MGRGHITVWEGAYHSWKLGNISNHSRELGNISYHSCEGEAGMRHIGRRGGILYLGRDILWIMDMLFVAKIVNK